MRLRSMWVSASVALVSAAAFLSLAFALAHVPSAHAQPAKKVNTSVGARTAACKKDCSSGNLHGTYRAYGSVDPQLKSPESRKLYNECVRLCLDPLPATYVQRSIIESGGSWFGQTKADCLGCHAAGKPKRNWPGINTLPDALKR